MTKQAIRGFIESLAIRRAIPSCESPLFGASRYARFAIRTTLSLALLRLLVTLVLNSTPSIRTPLCRRSRLGPALDLEMATGQPFLRGKPKRRKAALGRAPS